MSFYDKKQYSIDLYFKINMKREEFSTYQRFVSLKKALSIKSVRQLELTLGLRHGRISNLSRLDRSDSNIASDVLISIGQKYPQVNINWLITGKGTMFVEDELSIVGESLNNYVAITKENINAQRTALRGDIWDGNTASLKDFLDKLTHRVTQIEHYINIQ